MTTDAIGFNNIPGAGLTAPLFGFEVNSGGQYDGTTRAILFGHATAAGSIAALTPTAVASQNDADRLAGPGSMLREMYRIFSANAPVQPVWLVALPEVGAVEVRTITIAAPTATGVGMIHVDGEPIQVTVGPTDTATTIAAALAAAINAYYNPLTNAMLPLTAASAAGVLTLTMRHAGAIMSDVFLYVPKSISNNVFAASNALTIATTTPGAGVPVVAAALATLGDDPADFVVSPWSDATSLAAYTTWANDQNGRWSFNRQSYGHVWAPVTGSFSALVTLGLTLNDRHTTLIGRLPNTPRSSWLWVAARCALEAPWLSDCITGNVSRNQTGRVIQGLAAPYDRSTYWNYAARNTLLNSGISTFTVNADGTIAIDKTVTTYRVGTSGQPDIVFRDVQALYQTSGSLSYIRAVLAQEQGQKAIANTNPGSLAAISTTTDIAGTFIHAVETLCTRGVLDDSGTFSSLLKVQRDPANPARVNVYAPLERINPLDIIAANATIYAAYPAS